MSKVLVLPGDGIGQEIVEQALKVINHLNANNNLNMELV
ncbi:MAG: 3-isopropylmalate dehydrogenase, partial [Candidatus Thioglobus sp.]|nr:3-isopropylmalate dehydrogenase [Candidatus Thioglobus sp.]